MFNMTPLLFDLGHSFVSTAFPHRKTEFARLPTQNFSTKNFGLPPAGKKGFQQSL